MKKRLIGFFLIFALVIGVMPLSGMTAAAADRQNTAKIFATTYGGDSLSTALNNATATGYAGDLIYFWLVCYDKNSLELLNSYTTQSYTANIIITNPAGEEIYNETYVNTDRVRVNFSPSREGTYRATVHMSGFFEGTISQSYTVSYNAGLTLSSTSTYLYLNGTNTKTITVTPTGKIPGAYGVQYDVDDPSIVSCAWNGWNDGTNSLTLTAKGVGSTYVHVSFYENYTEDQEVLVTKSIYVSVSVDGSGITTLSANSSYTTIISTGGAYRYYSFTPDNTGKYVMYSYSATNDPRVYLYDGNMNYITEDDDGGDDNHFRLEHTLIAGQTYIFGVQFYNSSYTGDISFRFGKVSTITYDANGGSGAPSSQSKDYGKSATLSTTKPTRSGYTFWGWSTVDNAGVPSYVAGGNYTGNNDVTLYAVWRETPYAISANSYYEAEISTGNQARYFSFTPTSSGNYVMYSTADSDTKGYLYDTAGNLLESDDDDGEGTNFRLQYYLEADTEYIFAVKYYSSTNTGIIPFSFGRVSTVSYDANGGSGAPANQTKDYGTPITIPTETPTRSGYTFVGWSTYSARHRTEYLPGDLFNETYDTTLYAVWRAGVVTLSENQVYNAIISIGGDGKYYSFTPSVSGTYVIYSTADSEDTYVNLCDSSGLRITGDDDSGGNGNFRLECELEAGVQYYFVVCYYSNDRTGSIPVYFGRVSTITFDANGGTGAPSPQKKDYGKSITISDTHPTRNGYTFLGWSTSNTGTTVSYSAGSSYSTDGDITLYAVWQELPVALALNSQNDAEITTGGEKRYFSFTPSTTGTYVIYSTATKDTKVALYDEQGTCLADNDDGGENTNFRLEYSFTAGTTYIFTVFYYSSSQTGTIPFAFGEMFDVVYDANGGSGAPPSQIKTYGQTLTLSTTVPTRTGYTFLGWSASAGATSPTYLSGDSYTNNAGVTLYAVWGTDTYTLSYDANGGSGAPSSQTKTYGQTLTLSTTVPTRTGHTFLGWSTDSNATAANYSAGGSYNREGDTTLYAVWQVDTYTIRYNANGGSGEPGDQTKTYGQALTLSTTVPTKTGYTFLGWSASTNATTPTYLPGDSYTHNAEITLYAVWQVNTYTITYHANGGSGGPANQTRTHGQTLTISSTVPSRTGYTFLGWSKDANATTATYMEGHIITIAGNLDLYGVWKINTYTIHYDANGGSGAPADQTKTYGQTLTLSSTIPTRAGYLFLGWATSKTATTATYSPGASYTTNGNLNLYAVWELIVPTKVEITSLPQKTTYYSGDSWDSTGLALRLTYSDNTTQTVTSGFTVSGFSSASAGTKTITVSYGGFSQTFTVTVNTPTISLSASSLALETGETYTLNATTTPTGQNVTWHSSNTNVVSVSSGKVTGVWEGSATVTGQFTYNGITYSKSCAVTVTLSQADVDRLAAEEVVDLIATIPDTVTLEHKDLLANCRTEYNNLTQSQKDLVSNYGVLTQAEARYEELYAQFVADTAAAGAVTDLIASLPSIITTEHKEVLDHCRQQYDALTPAQRELVTNYAKLIKAEKDYAVLIADAQDKAAAKVVIDMIASLPQTITLEHKGLLDQCQEAYQGLTFVQQALVSNYETLESAVARYEELYAQFVADTAAAKSVSDLIASIPFAITLEHGELIEECRESYEALTQTAKKMVTNYQRLQQALGVYEELCRQYQEDLTAAKEVEDLIATIPQSIGVEHRELIEQCGQAFDRLTATQQKLVENAEILTRAQQELKDLLKDLEGELQAVKGVESMIASLPQTITLQYKASLEMCRIKYNSLSDGAKLLVSNFARLEEAEAQYQALVAQQQADKDAAGKVTTLIAALPDVIDSTHKELVQAARQAYEALTQAQQALVTGYDRLVAAEEEVNKVPVVTIAYGDVNEDGKIDAKDALAVLKISVGKTIPTQMQQAAADGNGDGTVNAKDALEILKFSVGKPSVLDQYYKNQQ